MFILIFAILVTFITAWVSTRFLTVWVRLFAQEKMGYVNRLGENALAPSIGVVLLIALACERAPFLRAFLKKQCGISIPMLAAQRVSVVVFANRRKLINVHDGGE